MAQNDKIQLFEDKRIRTAWDEEKEEWYFSIVDVVAVLTDQPDQRHAAKYWSVLKTRLKKEGSELTTNCSQLKMRSADNKRYMTDENLVTMPVTRFFLCSKFQFSLISPLTAKFPLRAGGGFLFHTYPV